MALDAFFLANYWKCSNKVFIIYLFVIFFLYCCLGTLRLCRDPKTLKECEGEKLEKKSIRIEKLKKNKNRFKIIKLIYTLFKFLPIQVLYINI